MGDFLENPSIFASIVGVGGMLAGALIGYFAKVRMSRTDFGATVLSEGWTNFTIQLQNEVRTLRDTITALEQRVLLCEKDRLDLWQKIREREQKGL